MENITFSTQRQPYLVSNEFLQHFQTIAIGFRCVMCVMGMCTNFLNLNTFLKIGLKETVTISFFALAVSDFLYCTLTSFGLVPSLMSVAERNYSLYFYLRPMVIAFFIMCVRRTFSVTSVLITTFLAIQRCLSVVLPFHVKGVFTRSRTFCFMAIIFTFSLICSMLFTFPHRTREFRNPKFNATQLTMYRLPDSDWFVFPIELLFGIVINFGCQAIVLISLVVMGMWLRKSAQFRRWSTTGPRPGITWNKQNTSSKETLALIQVSIVCAIFITMNIPFVCLGITKLLVADFGPGLAFRSFYRMFYNIVTLSELCNASLNFFVYFKYNSKFRACFSVKI